MRQIVNSLKKVMINADDFAQSEAIDAAIIDLANRKIISSTSVLVLSPRWQQSAKQLVNLPIQVGLHLDLTSAFSKQYGCNYGLSKLIFLAYTRQLSQQYLEKIIELQWDRFCEFYGGPPDFIDGHQHVHQLPMVRDALFSIIAKKAWETQQNHWLRSCYSKQWRGFKAMIVSILGAQFFTRKAFQLNINTNSDFAGVYNFNPKMNLKKSWESWLDSLTGHHALVMCHVAMPNLKHDVDDNVNDAIYNARLNEYQWLASDDFLKLIHSKGFSQSD